MSDRSALIGAGSALVGAFLGGVFGYLGVLAQVHSAKSQATDQYFRTASKDVYVRFLTEERAFVRAVDRFRMDLDPVNPNLMHPGQVFTPSLTILRKDRAAVDIAARRLTGTQQELYLLAGPGVVNASNAAMASVNDLASAIDRPTQLYGERLLPARAFTIVGADVKAKEGDLASAVDTLITEARKNLGVNVPQT